MMKSVSVSRKDRFLYCSQLMRSMSPQVTTRISTMNPTSRAMLRIREPSAKMAARLGSMPAMRATAMISNIRREPSQM